MTTHTLVPLKYRRKSSPPPSPRMLSPITPFQSSFISPPPKWLDSDDDLDHEPALTSDDALTVLSSSCSRAPSLAPLDTEDAHVDIVSSPVRETFFRTPSSSRAPHSRYNNHYSQNQKSSTTREDVAAALLSLHAQPRLGPSQPLVTRLPPQSQAGPSSPPRRPRVVTPSLRNLVLPRTPSPPPRSSFLLTTSPVIDHGPVHATAPSARRTPSCRATPSSSPLPPSSPLTEEADYETSGPSTFHSVPCSKPESDPLQAHTPSDYSDADKHAPPWSRDDEPKEECDNSLLVEHEVQRTASSEPSPVTAVTPHERHLENERSPSAPPFTPLITESSTALSPKSGDQHRIPLPVPDDPKDARPTLGAPPESPVSAAPSPSAVRALSMPLSDSPLPDIADQDTTAVLPSYSRAASSTLTPLDDSTPPSPPHDFYPASSPLSSPPASPSPEKQYRQTGLSLPTAGAKRRSTSPLPESDLDASAFATGSTSVAASASGSAPPEHARARTKRRRRDSASDDKPWRNRKKQARVFLPTCATPTTPCSNWTSHRSQGQGNSHKRPQALTYPQSDTIPTPLKGPLSSATTMMGGRKAPAPAELPPSPSPRASFSSTTITTPSSALTSTSTPASASSACTSPTTDPSLDNDKKGSDMHPDTVPNNMDNHDDAQQCPHPALLGILIEALALSRASSLPLSTLTRTTPALAGYPQAVLTATLAWAVSVRILGCVRSSGESLPPTYFYDPAADPDRERGELLRCLMPRAGKRRETMKYKQYYWAPVVVGRRSARTWDVDWEE